MADAAAVIQATLAPIFLVSGAAIFLNFIQARLFRVVDRLRAIGKDLAEGAEDGPRRALLDERHRVMRRLNILRNAILFGTLVIALTVATTLLLLIPQAFFGVAPGRSTIVVFALALASFAIALFLVVTDAFLSVATARYMSEEFGQGLRPGER